MPYAQLHYPFENKDKFEKNFPADFIAEGLDQVGGLTLSWVTPSVWSKGGVTGLSGFHQPLHSVRDPNKTLIVLSLTCRVCSRA